MRTTFTHPPWETINFGCESLQGGAFPTPACSAALQGSRQLVPHSNQNHYGTPRPVAPTLGLHEPGPAFDLAGLAWVPVRFCSSGRISRWGQTSLELSALNTEKYSSDLPDQSRTNGQLRYSLRKLYG